MAGKSFRGGVDQAADDDMASAAPFRSGNFAFSRTGTPGYWSPEAQHGDRHPDVDVWAVGVTFYQMLTGQRPS